MSAGTYLGCLEINEEHYFEIMQTSTRLVFGGSTNTGFLESGYIEIDPYFSLNENLQELVVDLECYYNDGPKYVSRIVCNERM